MSFARPLEERVKDAESYAHRFAGQLGVLERHIWDLREACAQLAFLDYDVCDMLSVYSECSERTDALLFDQLDGVHLLRLLWLGVPLAVVASPLGPGQRMLIEFGRHSGARGRPLGSQG